MNLTKKDAAATALAFASIAMYLGIRDGNWPLLGSPRAGIVGLWLVGQAMCATGTWTAGFRDPFTLVAILLGAIALGTIVVGLFVGSMTVVTVLFIEILALYVVSTIHHLMPRTIHPNIPALKGGPA
jgi:hypothetical protein